MNTIREDIQSRYEPAAQFFKLLAHPARLAILECLRGGEACVCHLEATLGFRQAYLSQQLALLREAGLINMRREGWNVYYQICDPGLGNVLDESRRLTGADLPSPEKRPQNCQCPKCSQTPVPEPTLEPILNHV